MITFWQAVWKCVLPDAATKIILLKLADYANTEGLAWPSLSTIARETALSTATVKRRIAWLDQNGYVVRRSSKDRITSNRYTLSLEKIQQTSCKGRLSESQGLAQGEPTVGSAGAMGRLSVSHEPSLNPHGTINEPKGSFLKETSNPELPYSSPPFHEAWKDWQTHLRERRHKSTPTAERLQIRQLTAMGEARAIAALRHSAASGYTGLYEPKDSFSKTKPTNPNRPSKYHAAPIL